jgi:hypothetical protein
MSLGLRFGISNLRVSVRRTHLPNSSFKGDGVYLRTCKKVVAGQNGPPCSPGLTEVVAQPDG